MDTVVVGVDGSEASGVALEFAVEEAVRRKGSLRVVSVWEMPAMAQPEIAVTPEVVEIYVQQANAIVEDAVARAQELQPDLPCEGVARAGYAGELLIEEGRGAALVVVGRRGHGGLTGLLLGSVSRHVADHAPCPVTIVPPLSKR
jgi:nucleotide-binding universal stress UspA family protein